MKHIPTYEEFLHACNLKARVRTFGKYSYEAFLEAIQEAEKCAKQKLYFYAEDNAGSVANAYKYVATTASWGVWVDPDTYEVVSFFGRVRANGNVKCARSGGIRTYYSDWSKQNPGDVILK